MKSLRLTAAALATAALALPALTLAQEPAAVKPTKKLTAQERRGEYLVTVGGCHDCHTPLKLTPTGPAPDMSRALSGHPEQLVMPPTPALPPGPWMTVASGTNTAWSGGWGTSFTANLTPDTETGTGAWTEQQFIETLRTGRHLGRGRQLLPPMPWFNYAKATDADLKAIFAYLRTVPAVKNRVPAPRPPAPAPATAAETP